MAGTLTTAWVLEVTTYHLLSTPTILSKLKTELTAAIPSPNDIGSIPLPTLESLPYLNAVMKEGLRLSYGTSCRLGRIDPDNAVMFRDKGSGREYVIPAGTPMGMTSVQIHHDEALFPDSKKFDPERWLDGKNKAIDKYLVAFTAGSRQCMGINLAQAELYLSLSAIWRVWGSREVRGADDVGWFELYETGKRDVEIESDCFLPIVQKGSQGIR
jgi:cytochrome P450